MILLIAGASHTGKTLLAQRLLEKTHYPYLSTDPLRVSLIRSGKAPITERSSSGEVIGYLWPVLREMIKINIQNGQNLIIEGGYIPFDWADGFTEAERRQIRYVCLVMSERYLRGHFADVLVHARAIEHQRDSTTLEDLLAENGKTIVSCRMHGVKPLLIDTEYPSADEVIAALLG